MIVFAVLRGVVRAAPEMPLLPVSKDDTSITTAGDDAANREATLES